jgi:hypothetical protein
MILATVPESMKSVKFEACLLDKTGSLAGSPRQILVAFFSPAD